MKKRRLCLLIGNSRWHWAIKNKEEWDFSHTSPSIEKLSTIEDDFLTWAGVGIIPKTSLLTSRNRLGLKDIPLKNLPSWIGIDRALGAWGAWQISKSSGISKNGFLVADAGTVLSLTKVNHLGAFDGGQLVPGLKLQLSAMANGTNNLPHPDITSYPSQSFPFETSEAMIKGSIQSLIGTIVEAQALNKAPIWLCGGDAPILYKSLLKRKINIIFRPNLVLEGMANLIDNNNPTLNSSHQ